MRVIRGAAAFIIERNIHWLEIALLVVIGLGICCTNLASVPFFRDETTWIWTSQRLEAFLTGNFHSDIWNPVEPPVTGYVIGVGRRLAGFHVADLNEHWRKPLGLQQNTAAGTMPSEALLRASRLPIASLGVLAVVMAAFLIAKGHSRVAAYLFSGLFFWNSHYRYIFQQAMNESPLLFFTLFGGVLVYMGMRAMSQERSREAMLAFALLGVAAGLAGETKTNGLGVAAAGVGAVLVGLFIVTPGRARMRQIGMAAGILGITLGATILTFWATNPFLYGPPLQKIRAIAENRTDLLIRQERLFPESVITTANRWDILPNRIYGSYATFAFPYHFHVGIALSIIGVVAACYVVWRVQSGWEAQLVLLSFAAFCAGPALFTPLDWDRYYMYPVVFARVYISIGAATLLALLLRPLAVRRPAAMRPEYAQGAAPGT